MSDHPGIQIVKPSVELLSDPDEVARIPQLLERCIRTCYKSENKTTADSADMLIRRVAIKGKDEVSKHESVLEHGSITVRFTFSRTASHQLVRHRIGSYSQESQRFCNYSKKKHGKLLKVVLPPAIGVMPEDTVFRFDMSTPSKTQVNMFKDAEHETGTYLFDSDRTPSILMTPLHVFLHDCLTAYNTYLDLIARGVKAEDARFVLPNACKTEVCTTYNIRQWRHVFALRCDSHAQWEIRGTMQQALAMLIGLVPCCFDDLADLL